MTPIIEAVCNSIDSIGNLPNGTIDIMAIRDGQKSYEGNTSVSGSIIGFDIGLGYRVRTLPRGRNRWGKITLFPYLMDSLDFFNRKTLHSCNIL